MLKITRIQMELMKSIALNLFVDRMVNHLNQFFPNHCQVVDNQKLKNFIHVSITKAATYNIVKECDVVKFIDLMVAVRSDFDSDPYLQKILLNFELTAETRLNLVHQKIFINSNGKIN